MFESVLIPTDGSERSERAAAHGLALATAYSGSEAKAPLQGADEADNAIDFGVVSRHSRSGLDRFVTRPTAERVLRNADAPVLTVPGSETS